MARRSGDAYLNSGSTGNACAGKRGALPGTERAGGERPFTQVGEEPGCAAFFVTQADRNIDVAEDPKIPAGIDPASGATIFAQHFHGPVDCEALAEAAQVKAISPRRKRSYLLENGLKSGSSIW